VLLAALGDRGGGLVEVELPEDHGEVAGVVLDRRDVVDGLAEKTLVRVYKLCEGILLDSNEIRQFQRRLEASETAALTRINSQDGSSLGEMEAQRARAKRDRARQTN